VIEGVPSRTAFGAALHRAVHQVVDRGRVFPDPLAVPITGWSERDVAAHSAQHPEARALRIFIAMRHAFARDVVAAAVADGARQVVVLGAGLDTIAYQREQPAPDLHVLEIDHPATQAWKHDRLGDAGIAPTAAVSYAAVDFETESWVDAVLAAGLDPSAPCVVVWLGVVPYLTLDAVRATLMSVSALAPGSSVVLDYGEPRDSASRLETRVARAGEPFRTRLTRDEMHALLLGSGLEVHDDLGSAALVRRYLGIDVPDRPGGHLLRAVVPAPG
jgi:methyltransferase (TIGR00027 family)